MSTTATTTAEPGAPRRRKVPATVRVAQLLMLIPLGAFQLVATIVFLIILPVSGGGDLFVAIWAPIMELACVITALRMGRGGPRIRTVALVLLAIQTAFGVVKLVVYGESASFIFLGFIAVCAGLLALPASRRHFQS
jgi:hypothetical protein